MSNLIEALATQLERPREVTFQVANYLNGTYDVDRDVIGPFLVEKLPSLEDYEHDLILSPLFTPKLADQAIFAELLGRESVPRTRWPELIRELTARPARAQLVTSDNRVHRIPLREVTIERYVNRLRLDGTMPESLFGMIQTVMPAEDRPVLKAVARRAVWETESRRDILTHYLAAAQKRHEFQLGDAVHLLGLVESYKPADRASLLAMIPPWQKGLRHDIETASSPRPFFTPQTQGEHGGDRDQRRPDERRIDAKRNDLAILGRIQQVLSD